MAMMGPLPFATNLGLQLVVSQEARFHHERELTNGPLSKLLELLDTQV